MDVVPAFPSALAITKAVIPAAGKGTRLRPLTEIAPKEMLPLGRKPAVEYVLEELHEAGITDIIFVIAPSKTGIRSYFGDSALSGSVRLSYVMQDPQMGLADAILQAEPMVGGDRFVVALGDTIVLSERDRSPLTRLLGAYSRNPASAAITVERVPRETAYRSGMVSPVGTPSGEAFEIDGLVEKPRPEDAPSEFAIGGRYVFPPDVFDWIRRTPPGVGGEHQITDSIALALREGRRAWCAPILEGERRLDIGDFATYSEAFAATCMLDPELSAAVLRATRAA